ncbi:exocyst complex component EXO70B1-like [Vicia villosa]|uniref:exocyst complex component EXO70B1-like n=1 Tax=Vicia villosa TaxID=3911 RepID=UPI00273B916F|nr:exocyst complex component EXO70B1-like [Vicia villosa]
MDVVIDNEHPNSLQDENSLVVIEFHSDSLQQASTNTMVEELSNYMKLLQQETSNHIDMLLEWLKEYRISNPNFEGMKENSNLMIGALSPEAISNLHKTAKLMITSGSDLSFMDVCRESTLQLLNFADAIAIGGRSTERLFRVLNMFETMHNLMPEFKVLLCDQYGVSLRNEVLTIWNRLGKAIRGISMELEHIIRRDPAKVAVPGGGIHPITRYVMNYLSAACWSQKTLEQVFEDYGVLSSHSLSVQMDWIMELLDSNLEAKSRIYKDPALCYENSGSVPPNAIAKSMKEKLKSFNALFDELCRVQSSWFIFDEQLKEEIRISIEKLLLPA